MSDRNYASFIGEGVIENREFLPPSESGRWDDVLKFSRAKYRIRGRVVAYGGFENACDINNGSEVIVEDGAELVLVGGEQAGLVVKGNSILRTEGSGRVVFKPAPHSRCDILKDDWSDQSDHSSTVEGNLVRSDGKPLRVVWGRGARPKPTNSKIQPIWWWIIGAHVWNFIRGLMPLMFLCAGLAGCAPIPKALQGGKAESGPAGAMLTQPENPAASSTQTFKQKTVRKFAKAPAAGRNSSFAMPAPAVAAVEISEESPVTPAMSPAIEEETTTTETTTTIGAAQKDTSREIAAKLAAMAPMQWVGVGIIVASLAMFHPAVRKLAAVSREMQAMTALVGFVLIYAPSFIVGNELLILGGLVAVWVLKRLSYKSGIIDANKNGIPDDQESS